MLRAFIEMFGGLLGAPVSDRGSRKPRLIALALLVGALVAVAVIVGRG